MDKISLLRGLNKAKDFLLSERSREFFVFLFFFFVTSAFWVLQTLNNDYESEFKIPVKLKDMPSGVVVTTEPVDQLTVSVKDKGTVLLNYLLTKNFYPLSLEFSDYEAVNNKVSIPAALLEKKIASQFKVSSKILAIKPDTVEYYYTPGVPKRLPVRLNGRVEAGREYYLSDTLFTPDSVWAYAPQPILDTLSAVYTHWLEQENICDTMRRKVELATVKGVKFEPLQVEMELATDIYTEKTVEVPVEGINFPAGKVLRVFPSKVQVTFQVGMGRFRQIDEKDFCIQISYNDLLRLGNEPYRVTLTGAPADINQVRCNPSSVDFLIEQSSSQL